MEPGKLADVALWRMDDLPHAWMSDPVAALVFGATPRAELLLVNGEVVVEGGELRMVDEKKIAKEIGSASPVLAGKVEVASK